MSRKVARCAPQVSAMTIGTVIGVVFGVILAVGQVRGEEEEAVKVYREVSPSVVALENEEGSGTGVLLDTTGLILTNAHVVASPMPFTCKVDVKAGSKYETAVFKHVKIVGFHPKLDLAAVRIDPKEHPGQLLPARFSKQKASPGQRVYVIGNPGGGGMILEKTITAGSLSGVDRMVEGVSYYQTDAAINHGNSGGPLCDRTGQVLGLVTLKFTDVENVGFAIPLNDLKTEAFVPLAKRTGDPAKAKELLVLADKLFTQSELLLKQRRGKTNDEVNFLKANAAKLYHVALTYDPSNDSIYYNFGRLLRQFDADGPAAAYLLAAIQINPWSRDNSDYYRELGLALVKQKKPDEAIAAWGEGVAKFPDNGGRIYEDIAVYWTNAAQPDKAAMAAQLALHLHHPNARMDVLNGVLNQARQKMTPPQQREFEKFSSNIPQALVKLKATAQQNRQNGKSFMTPDFAKFVKATGTLSEGEPVKLSIARDPASKRPIESPPADEAPKEDAAQPAAAPTELAMPEGSVDLLRMLRLKQDAEKGTWKLDDHVLPTPFVPFARLGINYMPPEEYDLTLVLERKSGQKEFVVGLVRGGAQTMFSVDGEEGTFSGLDSAAASAYHGLLLTNNQPATLVFKVRKQGIMVTADGKKIFFERETGSLPEVPAKWKMSDTSKLFVGSNASKYVVHKLFLTPYKKGAK